MRESFKPALANINFVRDFSIYELRVDIVFGDKDKCQKPRSRHAARDGTAGRGCLHHCLAAPARFFQPRNLDHFQLGCDHFEDVGDVLTNQAQRDTAFQTGLTRIEFLALAGRGLAHTRLAARRALTCFLSLCLAVHPCANLGAVIGPSVNC